MTPLLRGILNVFGAYIGCVGVGSPGASILTTIVSFGCFYSTSPTSISSGISSSFGSSISQHTFNH
jgi:hypothetical protein